MRPIVTLILFAMVYLPAPAIATAQNTAQDTLRVFISVDMEGIGGIGTRKMVNGTGKDYATGRSLMTEEVNAVVDAIFSLGPAQILVNDSHGDMQNLLHTELDPRVVYIQGNIKPLGMVQGLDASFDAVVFLGYHMKAGSPGGFLAHTGSSAVRGLWINGTEVGEGGLNAAYAGSFGVPVVLASGDRGLTEEMTALLGDVEVVATKTAVTNESAELVHPDDVRRRLGEATRRALGRRVGIKSWDVGEPVTVRLQFSTPTRAEIVSAIPSVTRVDGTTVTFEVETMEDAYRLIRVLYKYISW